ncbi:hypothetical protein SPHV1_690019 [Novosphingobium sp. KN65.2]|nr:hypothetical protein SPHV1_690019 [Novosphingobium sp. KN65.2]
MQDERRGDDSIAAPYRMAGVVRDRILMFCCWPHLQSALPVRPSFWRRSRLEAGLADLSGAGRDSRGHCLGARRPGVFGLTVPDRLFERVCRYRRRYAVQTGLSDDLDLPRFLL